MGIENNSQSEKTVTGNDVEILFAGEELSEEFKTQAKSIFEAAVKSKVDEETSLIQEQLQKEFEEQAEEFSENLIKKVDEYLDYVVKEWMETNSVAIDTGLKSQIAEDFMVGLKNLFIENYVDIPEDKEEVVQSMAERVSVLETEVDTLVSEQKSLIEELNEYKKEMIISNFSEGLSEVQFEKLKTIAENIEFVSEEDYTQKINLTKKKYFSVTESNLDVTPTETQTLDTEETLDESFSPSMSRYVQSISRIVKK